MTIEEVKRRLAQHFAVHDDGKPTPYLDEAVLTMVTILDQAQMLINKFGSLEAALDAEKVTHCWECAIWRPDKTQGDLVGICNKPCESMRWRCYDEYCYEGQYYKKVDDELMNRMADIADLFSREHIMPAETIKAALERFKEDSDETLESV